MTSGDDAIHAEKNLILNPKTIDIIKSYEGLEGAYITLNGRNIKIISGESNKKFNWVCISTEKLITGKAYTLVINSNKTLTITANGSATRAGTKSQNMRFRRAENHPMPQDGQMPPPPLENEMPENNPFPDFNSQNQSRGFGRERNMQGFPEPEAEKTSE